MMHNLKISIILLLLFPHLLLSLDYYKILELTKDASEADIKK